MTFHRDTITGALTISGSLDIDTANSLREALWDCLLHQPEITVDLRGVERCDTAALQVLLASLRDAAASGKTFRLTEVAHPVIETAAALGVLLPHATLKPEKEQPHAN